MQNNITEHLLISQNTYTYKHDEKEETLYLIVPENVNELSNYISLTSTNDEKQVHLSDNGVTITSQMAEQLNLNVGENISIRNIDLCYFIEKTLPKFKECKGKRVCPGHPLRRADLPQCRSGYPERRSQL